MSIVSESKYVQLIARLLIFLIVFVIFRSEDASIGTILISFFIVFFPLFYFPKYQPFWLHIKSDTNTNLAKSANITHARSNGLSMLLTISYCIFYSIPVLIANFFIIDKLLVAFSYSTRIIVILLMYVISSVLFFRVMGYLAVKLNRTKKLGYDS